MVNTKERICACTIELFNEKGFSNVSLREIANRAQVAIGNLTYYFPQKGDLLLAIQEQQYSFFSLQDENKIGNCAEESIRALLNRYQAITRSRKSTPFLYRNNVEMSNESQAFYENVKSFRQRLYHFYLTLFHKLREYGVFRSDLSEKQYEDLAYILLCLIFAWEQEKAPYYDDSLPKVEFIEGFKTLVYPCFTEEGLEQYRSIAKEYGIEI